MHDRRSLLLAWLLALPGCIFSEGLDDSDEPGVCTEGACACGPGETFAASVLDGLQAEVASETRPQLFSLPPLSECNVPGNCSPRRPHFVGAWPGQEHSIRLQLLDDRVQLYRTASGSNPVGTTIRAPSGQRQLEAFDVLLLEQNEALIVASWATDSDTSTVRAYSVELDPLGSVNKVDLRIDEQEELSLLGRVDSVKLDAVELDATGRIAPSVFMTLARQIDPPDGRSYQLDTRALARDEQGHLRELEGTNVSPVEFSAEKISRLDSLVLSAPGGPLGLQVALWTVPPADEEGAAFREVSLLSAKFMFPTVRGSNSLVELEEFARGEALRAAPEGPHIALEDLIAGWTIDRSTERSTGQLYATDGRAMQLIEEEGFVIAGALAPDHRQGFISAWGAAPAAEAIEGGQTLRAPIAYQVIRRQGGTPDAPLIAGETIKVPGAMARRIALATGRHSVGLLAVDADGELWGAALTEEGPACSFAPVAPD